MRKDKGWLIISILIIVIALTWLGVSAYNTLRKSTVPPDVTVAITPLDPEIDKDIIPLLDKRAAD